MQFSKLDTHQARSSEASAYGKRSPFAGVPASAGKSLRAEDVASGNDYLPTMDTRALGRAYNSSAQQSEMPYQSSNPYSIGHQQRSQTQFGARASREDPKADAALESLLRTNPNFLIHQHNECKLDNKERLKNVSNLEDLVNFKVKTVADNLQEDTEKRTRQMLQSMPHHDGYPLELLSAHQLSSQASINVLKKMCDPLLANRHYPKLMAKKDSVAGKMTRDGQLMGLHATRRQEEKAEERYEIPEELKKHPKNYNLLPPKAQVLPQIGSAIQRQDSIHATDKKQSEKVSIEPSARMERNDSFLDQKEKFEAKQKELNEQSALLKQEHARNLEEQEALLQQKLSENENDPVNMLKRYFENKHKAKKVVNTKDLKKNKKVPRRISRSQMDHMPDQGPNDLEQHQSVEQPILPEKDSVLVGAVHAHYVISKYQKMKKTGKLDKLDEEIARRSRLLDHQQLARAQEQMNGLMMGIHDSVGHVDADFDGDRSTVSGLEKKKEFDVQQLQASAFENRDLWGADDQEGGATMAGVKKMRDELKHIFKDETADGYQQDMINPIDEMQIHETNQQASEKQKESFKQLQPLDQSHGASGRILVQQILNQIHADLDTNQFDKMQVFQEDLKNMQQLTQQAQTKTWKEDALLNEAGAEDESHDKATGNSVKVGLQHSELTKYQSVKASAGQKDYINYTKEQLEMAKNLKQLEAKHSHGKVTRATTSGGTNATIQTIHSRTVMSKKSMKSQGLARRRQMNLKDSVSDYRMGGVSLNLNGSLPQIKNQLERKKLSMPPLKSQKDFKEDKQNFEPYYDQMAASYNRQGQPALVNILATATRPLAVQNYYGSQPQGMTQSFGLPAHLTDMRELYSNQVIYGGKAIDTAFDQDGNGLEQRKMDPQVEIIATTHGHPGNFINARADAQTMTQDLALQQDPSQYQAAADQVNALTSSQPRPVRLASELSHRTSGETKLFSDIQNSPFDKSHSTAKYPYFDTPALDQNAIGSHKNTNRALNLKQRAAYILPEGQERDAKSNENAKQNQAGQTFGQMEPSTLQENIASNSRKSRGSRVSIYSNQRKKTPAKGQQRNEQAQDQRARTSANEGTSGDLRKTLAQKEQHINDMTQRQSRVVPFDVKHAVSTNERQLTESDAVQTKLISETKKMESVEEHTNHNKSKDNSSSVMNNSANQTGRAEAVAITVGAQANINLFSSTPDQDGRAQRTGIQNNTQKSNTKLLSTVNAVNEERTPDDTDARGSGGTVPERPKLESGGQDTNNNDSDCRRTSQSDAHDKNKKTAESFGQVRKVDIQNTTKYNRDLVGNLDNRHFQLFNEPLMNQMKQDPSQLSRRRQEQKRRADLKRSEFEEDKGYYSSNDPYMDQISSEMYEQIIQNHFIQRACWVPSRYKKFPRFTIFTSNKDQLKKTHQADQFISLNPQVLALLAGLEADDVHQPPTILEEQAVTNRTMLQQSVHKMRASSISPRRADALMDYEEIQEEKERIKELTKIMVDSLASQGGEKSAVMQSTTPLSVHKAPSKDEHRKEDESSKGLTLHDEFIQNSPLLIENMERKGKLGQAPSSKELAGKSKDIIPAMNTLHNGKHPTNDYTQPPTMPLSNQRDPTSAKRHANRMLRESRIAVDVGKHPDNSDISFLDAEKSLLVQQFDPFDKVLLTKGMDNQILTSFRTLEKSNNMISNTLKVIHQRFLAKELNKGQKIRIPRSKLLYPISQDFLLQYAQELLLDQELQKMSAEDRQQLVDNLQKLRLIDQQTSEEEMQRARNSVFIPAGGRASVSVHRQSMDSSDLNVQLNYRPKNASTHDQKNDSQKSINLRMDAKVTEDGDFNRVETQKATMRNKTAQPVDQKHKESSQDTLKLNPPLSTTMSKMQKLDQQQRRFPVSKYDIATGQVVRHANADKNARSTSPQNQSLLALTNEATKAALGQHQFADELQVASWRMNLFNMDPSYTKQSSQGHKTSQSPAFKPKTGKKASTKESHAQSKQLSHFHSVDSKLPSGLIDPGTHTKRDQLAEGSEALAEKDIKKLDNHMNLNQESIVGTSMLATPSYLQQPGGTHTLNASRHRANKISIDGMKERTGKRNAQPGTKEAVGGPTRNHPNDGTMRTTIPNHMATESLNDPTQHQYTHALDNDHTDQTNDKRIGQAENLEIVLTKQNTFASGRGEAAASQQLSRGSKLQSRSGAKQTSASNRKSMHHTDYGPNAIVEVKEVNVGPTFKLPTFDLAKSRDREKSFVQTELSASARNQQTVAASNPSNRDLQAIQSKATDLLSEVNTGKMVVNEDGGDGLAPGVPKTIIKAENIHVTDGHARGMISPKKLNPKFAGGFGNLVKLRSHLASALNSDRPSTEARSKDRGLAAANTQLMRNLADNQEVLNNAINQTNSVHLAEIQQVLLMMAQASHNQQMQMATTGPGQQHDLADQHQSPKLGEKDKRSQIRQIIDEIYQKDNRYMRKPKERSSLLNANDIIFDLSRAANLNTKVGPDHHKSSGELTAFGQSALQEPPSQLRPQPAPKLEKHETSGLSRVTFIHKSDSAEAPDPIPAAPSGLQSQELYASSYVKGSKIQTVGGHTQTFPSTLRQIPVVKSRNSDDEGLSQRMMSNQSHANQQ